MASQSQQPARAKIQHRPIAIPPRTSARRLRSALDGLECSIVTPREFLAWPISIVVCVLCYLAALSLLNLSLWRLAGMSLFDLIHSLHDWLVVGVYALLVLLLTYSTRRFEQWLHRRLSTPTLDELKRVLEEHLCVRCKHPLTPSSTAASAYDTSDVRCPECGYEQPYD